MRRRKLVVVVVAAHLSVLSAAALIGGCARARRKALLSRVKPVEDIEAPEGVPETILEPEGVVEEAELLVAREPEEIRARLEERATPPAAAPEVAVEVAAMASPKELPAEKAPIIPRLRPPAERLPEEAGKKRTHTVAAGENLWRISKMYGTTVAEIARLNDLDPRAVLRVGQVLVIPQKAEIAGEGVREGEEGAGAAGEAAGEYRRHTVRKGDSLWSVSRRYGVSVKEIVEINRIEDPSKIKVGRVLLIPK